MLVAPAMLGARRLLFVAGCAAGVVLLAGCDPNAKTFDVNSMADAPDEAPGNGQCRTASGTCTLRGAVMEANAHTGNDVILLDDGATYGLSIGGAGEDAAATGDLDITQTVTIRGRATIDANALDRVLDLRGGTLVLDNVSIIDGSSTSGGGGIRAGAERASPTVRRGRPQQPHHRRRRWCGEHLARRSRSPRARSPTTRARPWAGCEPIARCRRRSPRCPTTPRAAGTGGITINSATRGEPRLCDHHRESRNGRRPQRAGPPHRFDRRRASPGPDCGAPW